MAKISKSGIGTNNIIRAEHLTRIIDALDGTGSAEIVATGSFTGSFTGAGYFDSMTVDNITVNQTASINYLETVYETASVIYSSGSTKFGDTADDTHRFTGTVNVTGSLYVSESLTANGLTYPSTANANKGWHLESDGNGNIVIDRARIYADVKNVTGGTLFKGTPVHVSSSVGNIDEVIAASASNAATMPATFVLAQDLADQQEGLGILTGFINGVDTSAFGEGDVIYVDYNGGYTNVKPTGSAQIQNLGIVTQVAVNGSGFVYGSGRSTATPNLLNGEVFYGIGDTAVQIPLGDIITGSNFNYSGSFTGDASGLINIPTATTASYILGSNVDGTVASASYAVSASYAPATDIEIHNTRGPIDTGTDESINNTDHVFFYLTTAPGGTLNLPTSPATGREIIFIRTSGTDAATLNAGAGSLINGAGSYALPTTLYARTILISDGTDWYAQ